MQIVSYMQDPFYKRSWPICYGPEANLFATLKRFILQCFQDPFEQLFAIFKVPFTMKFAIFKDPFTIYICYIQGSFANVYIHGLFTILFATFSVHLRTSLLHSRSLLQFFYIQGLFAYLLLATLRKRSLSFTILFATLKVHLQTL